MRLLAFLISLIALPAHAQDSGTWTYLQDRQAIATPALEHVVSPGEAGAPQLVIVCNNLTRLTYVDWPTDFGVDRKLLPSHLSVAYDLTGTRADFASGQVWTVSQSEAGRTYVITHDKIFPEMLMQSDGIQVTVDRKQNLPAMQASFDLRGLREALRQNRIACTNEDQMLQSRQDAAAPVGPAIP